VDDSGEKIEKVEKVKVLPINQIFDEYLEMGQHIDFISIDV
jgi:hypothetical protein